MPKELRGLSWKGYEGQDYENFWTGPAKQYLDELEQLIVSQSLPGGNAVVDIGAGFGRMGRCYIGKYRSVHMVEPASNLREVAARTYGDSLNYHEASIYELPFADESFDAAVMVRVFHHLGNSEAALREIHRILKPRGRLVFNYSNKRNIKRLAQFLTGRARNPLTQDSEEYASTLIGHHPDYVEHVLSFNGFAIEAQYGVGVMDKVVGVFPFMGRLLRPSMLFARLLGLLRLAPAQFVVACKR